MYRSLRSPSTNKPKQHANALSCLTVNDERRVRNLFVPRHRWGDEFVEVDITKTRVALSALLVTVSIFHSALS